MVQRFSVLDSVSSDHGEYVKYEDYMALELKTIAADSYIERALGAKDAYTKDYYIKKAMEMLTVCANTSGGSSKTR